MMITAATDQAYIWCKSQKKWHESILPVVSYIKDEITLWLGRKSWLVLLQKVLFGDMKIQWYTWG